MAEGADAVDATAGFQLVGAGIDIDLYTVEFERPAGSFFQTPHVRPDVVGTAAVGLALAGIDYEDLVHLAVAVPVVVGEVDILVGGDAHLLHHLIRVLVVIFAVVLAVVLVVVHQRVRPHDVEDQVEQSAALVSEVVSHAADESFSAGEVNTVEDVVVFVPVVASLELLVAELGQNDQAVLRADERVAFCVFSYLTAQLSCPGHHLSRWPSSPAAYATSLRRGCEGDCKEYQ